VYQGTAVVYLKDNITGTTDTLGDEVGMKSGMILGDSDRRAVGGPKAHDSGKSRPRDKEKQHYNNQQANAALVRYWSFTVN